jgi:hypothetical protein
MKNSPWIDDGVTAAKRILRPNAALTFDDGDVQVVRQKVGLCQ